MGTHDPTPSCNTTIKEGLHNLSLATITWQANTITLPITAGPIRLGGDINSVDTREEMPIPGREFASTSDDFRKTLELFATDGCLNVRHTVIESKRGVAFKDNLLR